MQVKKAGFELIYVANSSSLPFKEPTKLLSPSGNSIHKNNQNDTWPHHLNFLQAFLNLLFY